MRNSKWLKRQTRPMAPHKGQYTIILLTVFSLLFEYSNTFVYPPSIIVSKKTYAADRSNEFHRKDINFSLSSVQGRSDLSERSPRKKKSRLRFLSSLNSKRPFHSLKKESILRKLRRKKRNNNKKKNTQTNISLIPDYQSLPNKNDFRRRFLESYRQSAAMHKEISREKSQPVNLTTYSPESLDNDTDRPQIKELISFDGNRNYNGYWNKEGKKKDRSILSYLPFHILNGVIPPKSEELIINITWQYINMEGSPSTGEDTEDSNDIQTQTSLSKLVSVKNIMDMFDDEYVYVDLPFQVGNLSYESGKGKRATKETETYILLSKLLSFAALYRLPSEVVTQLLNACSWESNITEIDNKIIHDIRDQFHSKAKDIGATDKSKPNGWNTVSFPQGLSLKINRKYLQTRLQRFERIRRINHVLESLSARKKRNQASAALKAIAEASTVRPPRKVNRWKNIDILNKLDANLREVIRKTSSDYDSYWLAIIKNPFFPTRRFKKIQRRWRSIVRKMKKNKQSIIALFLLSILSFCWYVIRKFVLVHQSVNKIHTIPVP